MPAGAPDPGPRERQDKMLSSDARELPPPSTEPSRSVRLGRGIQRRFTAGPAAPASATVSPSEATGAAAESPSDAPMVGPAAYYSPGHNPSDKRSKCFVLNDAASNMRAALPNGAVQHDDAAEGGVHAAAGERQRGEHVRVRRHRVRLQPHRPRARLRRLRRPVPPAHAMRAEP